MSFLKRSYLNARVPNSFWDKITKHAHEVWDMDTEGESVLAIRKKPDTARLSEHAPDSTGLADYGPGDLVLLFMGGKKIAATIHSFGTDNTVTLDTDEGLVVDIPMSWLHAVLAGE